MVFHIFEGKTDKKIDFLYNIMVSKSQKQISKFSFEPKTYGYFLISALASKMSQLKKYWLIFMLSSDYLLSNIIICIWFFDLTHFRELGQKYRNFYVPFWFKWKLWNLLLRFTDLYEYYSLLMFQSHKLMVGQFYDPFWSFFLKPT